MIDIRGDEFLVVTNSQGRRSIWPSRKQMPGGWQVVQGPFSRHQCLDFLRHGAQTLPDHSRATSSMQLGLMFFGDQENSLPGSDKYQLVMECAKLADRQGLHAVWLPERHFTKFGCLFPSPAVLHAALARETERIRLRAGSVVMPLHHPVRVAEEWSVVDNLSGGRVDLAFASGWHANDFALWPQRYPSRKQEMLQGIEQVQRLWRGESIQLDNGAGEPIDARIYPTPLQAELPTWLTAATSLETFRRAGEMGANVLTHLFDQQVDELANRIAVYRDARRQHGWSVGDGKVTVTLHAFIGSTLDEVREQARRPYCQYLKSNFSLLKSLALSRGVDVDISQLPEQQLDEMLNFLFEKFLGDRSLLGTSETCCQLLEQLEKIGVDEVACLVDFGISPDEILSNLPRLAAVNRQFA